MGTGSVGKLRGCKQVPESKMNSLRVLFATFRKGHRDIAHGSVRSGMCLAGHPLPAADRDHSLVFEVRFTFFFPVALMVPQFFAFHLVLSSFSSLKIGGFFRPKTSAQNLGPGYQDHGKRQRTVQNGGHVHRAKVAVG